MVEVIKRYWNILLGKGLFHMLGANILNKIISFSSAIVLVRILTKDEYGTYAYVQNLVSFFLLVNGLGVVSGLLQFGSQNRESEFLVSYFRFGAILGVGFNFCLVFFICILSLFLSVTEEIRCLIMLFSITPLFNLIFELIQVYNQVERNNKFYSILTSVNTFLYAVLMLFGAYFYQVKGIIIFNYIAIIATILIGLPSIRSLRENWKQAPKLQVKQKKCFTWYSLTAMFNNSISFLVYILDVFLIGLIIPNLSVIASYKTATIIPFALNFIPTTIMIFVYPYFVEHMRNKEWIKINILKLFKVLLGVNLLISLLLIIFSTLIIKLCFGELYLDSIPIFIILSIGYFFAATLRIPAGNILAALGKVNLNFYITLGMGVFTIIVDLILIKMYGSIGAAIATLLVFIFSGIIASYMLFKVIKRIY